MLTFKKFVKESEIDEDDLGEYFDQIPLEEIKKDCSEWIKNVSVPAFRGYGKNVNTNVFLKYPVKTNRPPRHSEQVASSLFNLGIESATGIKRVRNTSVFASNNYGSAGTYGKVYYILAPNGYEIIYSPKVADAYTKLGGSKFSIFRWMWDQTKFRTLLGPKEAEILNWFPMVDHDEGDIGEDVSEFNKWAVKNKFPYAKEFSNALKLYFGEFFEYQKGKTFESPNHVEIMITNVPYIYMARVDVVREKFREVKGGLGSKELYDAFINYDGK